MTSAATAPLRPRIFPRWSIGLAILLIGVVAQLVLWQVYAEDPTFSAMSVLWVWPATLFAFAIWWTFFSGWTMAVRASAWGLIAAMFVVFLSVFRLDGSDGDMIPKLEYRWTPSARQKAAEYLQRQSIPAPAPVEATTETPVANVPAATDDDSTDFRGNLRDGIIRGAGFRKDWADKPLQEVWRHPIGLGWSSFSVLGDLAITQEQRGGDECVVAYQLATGEPVWRHADREELQIVLVNGGNGPHCTPVIVGEWTYTLGGTGVLNCLATTTGARKWTRNILNDAGTEGTPVKNLEWGMSATPLVVDDLVICIPGGKLDDKRGKSVIAYDRMTGDIRWTSGSFPASYCGARVESLGGVRQVLVFHGLGICGLNLSDGKLLWEKEWTNMPLVNAAQPIRIDEQSLLIGNGYGVGSARLSLSAAPDGKWKVDEVWKSNKLKLKFNDAVLHDGFVYGLDDGILTCIDVETGKTKWKGGRYGYGQILLHDDTLLVTTEEGDVTLVKAAPKKFEEQARIKAVEGTTWNHPVVAHGKLLVRNGTEAVCFDVAP
ncbi:MAG TPA: PQQ-binding-like beta-propeller repeat protein [Planctomycetaceae bacterium]|nr:PQQ-binding-like beta-propeller repeat protein [Planctomycetaceae bacterium]